MNISKSTEFSIRLACNQDFEEIFEIWQKGLSASFDITQIDLAEVKIVFLENFLLRKGIFNYWIAVNEFKQIIGWQSLNKCTVNPIKTNQFAESSTYVRHEARHLGVGYALLDYVIKEAEKDRDLKYITAYVAKSNIAIRKITNELGWLEIGDLPDLVGNEIQKLFIVRPV